MVARRATERPYPADRELYASRIPFDSDRVPAAAVYCSDGRYGEAIDEFLHVGLGLPRYDRVAAPGGAGSLGRPGAGMFEAEALRRQLKFLIDAHHLTRVVLVAHQDCGFYRSVWTAGRDMRQVQAEDLCHAAMRIRMASPQVHVAGYIALVHDSRVCFERVTTEITVRHAR